MRATRSVIITVLTITASTSGGAAAIAAPSGAPSSSTPVSFDCGPAGQFTGFTNSGNSQALTWNPFFLTGSDGNAAVLVPTANDLVVSYKGTVVFAPDATKGTAPGTVSCQVSGGSGALVVAGSVTGVIVTR